MKSGENASIDVTVSGSPELKTAWFKDNKDLSASAKYQMSLKEKVASLKVLSADKSDAGQYKLQVTNHVGTASCTVELSVSGLCPLCGSIMGPSVTFVFFMLLLLISSQSALHRAVSLQQIN